MAVSLQELKSEREKIILFSDAINIVLNQNKDIDFIDLIHLIFKNLFSISLDSEISLMCYKYDRVNGIYSDDELLPECILTLQSILSANFIQGIVSEAGNYFTTIDEAGFNKSYHEDFYLNKNELKIILGKSGIVVSFNEAGKPEEITNPDSEIADLPHPRETIQWSNFAGKETALKLIAGMAIALEKSGSKYIRGGKLNKSEVARTAEKLILEYGDGIHVTDKALKNLIEQALDLYASKTR